jgi:single-strand DNA-binding protein
MNEVVLIGRLVRDPEIRYTNTQMAICTFTLAVDRPFSRNRQDGTPTADFIRITVWDRQAENCSRYLTKGRQVAVQGRIQTGSYVNKEGRTVYTTDVVANRVEFLGSGNSQSGPGQYSQGGYQNRGGMNQGGYGQGGYGQNSYQPPSQPQPVPEPAVSPAPVNDFPIDDDLPEGFQTIDEDDIPF